MEIIRLTLDRVQEFTALRLEQLAEEGASSSKDLAPSFTEYLKKHLSDGSFISFIAVDNGKIVATSGMGIIEKPPFYACPNGKVGFISCMFTKKEYRRKGIAKMFLEKLRVAAQELGCDRLEVSASVQGEFLYTDFGFQKANNSMFINI